MKDLKTNELVQRLVKIQEKKKKQLEKRFKREKYLKKLADKEYSYNKEQWEAINECIAYQNNKRLLLTGEILRISETLAKIEKLRKEIKHEWYA